MAKSPLEHDSLEDDSLEGNPLRPKIMLDAEKVETIPEQYSANPNDPRVWIGNVDDLYEDS